MTHGESVAGRSGCLQTTIMLAVMLVVGALASGIVGNWLGNRSEPNDDLDTRELIRRGISEVNRDAPQMVDAGTRLDSASTDGGDQFFYNYTLVTLASDEADPSGFDAFAQDLKGRVCSSPDLMLYISRGITLTYRYHGRDGAEILRVPFDAATCSSTAPARVLVPVRSNAAPAQAVTPAHTPAGKDTYPDYSTRHNSRCWDEHQRAIQAIPEDASLVEAGERASEARRRLEACVE